MEMMQIVWLVLLILSIVAEAVTATLVSIWFCAGALVALLVSFAAPGAVVLQVILFVVVSAACLLALRPLVHRLVGNRRVPTNADTNIGKMCQVVSEIQPARFGRVVLEGLEWTAKADMVIPVGAWCQVLAIEGVKLVVAPVPQQAPVAQE